MQAARESGRRDQTLSLLRICSITFTLLSFPNNPLPKGKPRYHVCSPFCDHFNPSSSDPPSSTLVADLRPREYTIVRVEFSSRGLAKLKMNMPNLKHLRKFYASTLKQSLKIIFLYDLDYFYFKRNKKPKTKNSL